MLNYYSNAKLLIAGEYLVLNGATAFAVPLNCGQIMRISNAAENNNTIFWLASDIHATWFEARLAKQSFKIIDTTNFEKANFLVQCLKMAKVLNPGFLAGRKSVKIDNYCNFNINWGLGSSATFLSNLAWWAQVNPFTLAQKLTNGSGYDIACTRSQTPLFFKRTGALPEIESIVFNPVFTNNLYFVYSGTKQNSQTDVERFNQLALAGNGAINTVSEIAKLMAKAVKLDDFMKLMRLHEQLVSEIIKKQRVKEMLFEDFDGEIKSLGAWGGDFLLAASHQSKDDVIRYFISRGFATIIPFNQLVLKT